MKSARKMTSLLPWLFQNQSRSAAKRRREDPSAQPLEMVALDGDNAMVTSTVGERIELREKPVAIAVRKALMSMSRGQRPGLKQESQTPAEHTKAVARPDSGDASLDGIEMTDSRREETALNREKELATGREEKAALGREKEKGPELGSEAGDVRRFEVPAASSQLEARVAPVSGNRSAGRQVVRDSNPTSVLTAQDSIVASLNARHALVQQAEVYDASETGRGEASSGSPVEPEDEQLPSDRDEQPQPSQPATPTKPETPVATESAANDEPALSLVERMQQLEQSSALANQQAMLTRVYQEAIKSQLFDPQWYQATYRRTFENARAAFDDYLRKSRFATVNPSPRFDSETYHRMYLDVFHAQQSPLQHYLLHGREEGRLHTPATVRWFPREVIEPESVLSEAAGELKVALCLHVFYDDFIDRFATAIAHFPVKVDIFLTLADEKFEARARETFERHGRVGRVETRIVPNRGRNFGPMLVEYGPALGEYDLLCHLHSKKSLYSGKEQTQWAEYLIEYLLRDVSVVTRLLNAFADDATLGMYYPTTFWMMPGWVNHLTMNKGGVKEWQRRLGLGRIPDFLSYPAGGMFWSRPEALKGVLDQVWRYEDFPQEPLPNDDSMLHALERVIGPLVENLGYRQLFFYPPTGQFTTDNGYITSSYHGHVDHHLPSIQAHSCISFDVFDTLVRRRYTIPDYAKLKLGKSLAAQGLVETAADFVAMRNAAESDLRRRANFQGDVRIGDIYDEIGERLGVERERAQNWMSQEFELDLEMILPKDEMVELCNHLAASGHILWIISDSYYTRDQVGLMLRKAGVSAAYRLMVSSEEQARKDNGTLWIKVKQDLAREGISRHLHIGDNVVADAQRPGDMGLTTFHILHPMDKWRALGFPDVLEGGESLDEKEILKWGRLISEVGRNPFIGQ